MYLFISITLLVSSSLNAVALQGTISKEVTINYGSWSILGVNFEIDSDDKIEWSFTQTATTVKIDVLILNESENNDVLSGSVDVGTKLLDDALEGEGEFIPTSTSKWYVAFCHFDYDNNQISAVIDVEITYNYNEGSSSQTDDTITMGYFFLPIIIASSTAIIIIKRRKIKVFHPI